MICTKKYLRLLHNLMSYYCFQSNRCSGTTHVCWGTYEILGKMQGSVVLKLNKNSWLHLNATLTVYLELIRKWNAKVWLMFPMQDNQFAGSCVNMVVFRMNHKISIVTRAYQVKQLFEWLTMTLLSRSAKHWWILESVKIWFYSKKLQKWQPEVLQCTTKYNFWGGLNTD